MTDNIKPTTETLLTFPCDFPIKIFGTAGDEFEAAVLQIIHKHVPNWNDRVIESKASSNGKYKSLTITVHVESKEQLDRIYTDLHASPQVLMTL
jgi:uncharacterized protein